VTSPGFLDSQPYAFVSTIDQARPWASLYQQYRTNDGMNLAFDFRIEKCTARAGGKAREWLQLGYVSIYDDATKPPVLALRLYLDSSDYLQVSWCDTCGGNFLVGRPLIGTTEDGWYHAELELKRSSPSSAVMSATIPDVHASRAFNSYPARRSESTSVSGRSQSARDTRLASAPSDTTG
jgi:hypothetical protein